MGLNVLEEMRERFDVPVGLSDHTGSVFSALAAMARRANLVEVHVTFSRAMFGPDASSSLTFEDLSHLVSARDAFHEIERNPVDKDKMAHELADVAALFGKSIVLKESVEAGTELTGEMLAAKKPGTGIPAASLLECIGRRLKRDLPADQLLQWDDLE